MSCRFARSATRNRRPSRRWKTTPSTSSPGNCPSGSTATTAAADPPATTPGVTEAAPGPQVSPPALEPASDQRAGDPPASEHPASEHPEWLAPPEPPARGEAQRDRTLLDLLPTGILIYRLDRLLYANPAFLKRIGYASLHALEQAGGLDALYVEPGVSSASSTSEAGTPVTISASQEKTNERKLKKATSKRPMARPRRIRLRPTPACSRSHGTAIPRSP